MKPSEKFNYGVRIKSEPVDVSFTDNEYDIIDTALDVKDFQFLKCPQENPEHMLPKSDENHKGELDEIAVEFECQYMKLNVDLLAVAKIENWSQSHSPAMKNSNDYQTQDNIKIETLGAVKKESFVDDEKQLNIDFDCGLSKPSEENSVTKELIDDHRLETQTITTRSSTDIACEICSKKFSRKYCLKSHIVSVHHKVTHACNICGKTFSTKDYLKNHTIAVHKGVPNVCDTRGKSFAAKSCLKVHIDSVHHKITHACDICGKSFTQKGSLKTHIVAVHKEIKHTCDLCGKMYTRKVFSQKTCKIFP
ncbi:zinc finger protein 236-like [Trichogramma pretiosum]|uniref:zinc finger protein 236-like n=1 Tax=Trichogramma pretiosum TaxID=7493 RepID=UPI0006C9A136|nr:zinc finger protein 236-like [Trichogramma pretiosum]